jgi:hypothetical protein
MSMFLPPVSGGPMPARCGCDWPFNWTCEVTAFDPVMRSHHYVATIHQSGARRMDEAAANARAMTEGAAMAPSNALSRRDPRSERSRP